MPLSNSQIEAEYSCEIVQEALTPDELRRRDDINWAREDAAVQREYRDSFVAVLNRRVVGSGDTIREALNDARELRDFVDASAETPAVVFVTGFIPDPPYEAEERA